MKTEKPARLFSFEVNRWTYTINFNASGDFDSEFILLSGTLEFEPNSPEKGIIPHTHGQICKIDSTTERSNFSLHETGGLLNIYLKGDQWFRVLSDFKEIGCRPSRIFVDFLARADTSVKQILDGIEFRYSVDKRALSQEEF